MPKPKPPRRTRYNSTFSQPTEDTLKRKRNQQRATVRQQVVRKKKKAWKRKPSEFARIYGSKARVAWVKAQPSVASGKGPCENVHVIGGGTSRKADARVIVPLTHDEHRGELHQHGKEWFEARYGISLDFMAAQVELAWQAYLNQRKGV